MKKLTFEELPDAVARILESVSTIESKLETRQHQNSNWLSLDQLCDFLPNSPAKSTIYAKVAAREIPHKKEGGKLLFHKDEINEWLNTKSRLTKDQLLSSDNSILRRATK